MQIPIKNRFVRQLVLSISILLSFHCSESDSSLALNIDYQQLEEAYDIAREIPVIKSLLVDVGGSIVSEEYFNGYDPSDLHDVRSVTKSFTSALIGIAIDKGFIQNVDQPISDFFGEVDVDSLPEAKGNITIRQLLTMTCGLEWSQIGDYTDFNQWVNSSDQINYIIAKPFASIPGTQFNYNDGASHLTSIILEEAVGMSTIAFADLYLFNPLGVGEKSWSVDNRGYNYGCAGLSITPEDMLKFGRLFLNNGVYNGEQIIPADWVNESTQAHISTDNAIPYGPNYGYYFWITNERDHYIFYAMGYGGQFIILVPDLDAVIVATCRWWNTGGQADQYWYQTISVIMNNIIPAID